MKRANARSKPPRPASSQGGLGLVGPIVERIRSVPLHPAQRAEIDQLATEAARR